MAQIIQAPRVQPFDYQTPYSQMGNTLGGMVRQLPAAFQQDQSA